MRGWGREERKQSDVSAYSRAGRKNRNTLPPAVKVHDIFHVDRLSPYKGNEVNGLKPPPPEPVTIEGEEEYEVDHIRDSKMFG